MLVACAGCTDPPLDAVSDSGMASWTSDPGAVETTATMDVQDVTVSPPEVATDVTPDVAPADPWGPALAATVTVDGQLAVRGTYRGVEADLALDTGASGTTLAKWLAVDAGGGEGELRLGPITGTQQFSVQDLAEADAFLGVRIGALVGPDVLGLRPWVVFDWTTRSVHFPDALPPDPLMASWPFKLTNNIPVVDVDVGAAGTIKLIADTGSGVTVLTASIWQKLVAAAPKKPPERNGYVWKTLYGNTPAAVVRVPELALGSPKLTVSGSWAIVVPDESAFVKFLASLGLPKGFVGFPVYRRFRLAFSVKESRYVLLPKPSDPAPANEWTRVGLEVSWRPDGFPVEWVYKQTSAEAEGVVAGDRLVSIDAQAVAGQSLAAVRALLGGTPGETRVLGLTRAGKPVTATVQVEDLLPVQ